MGYLGNAAGLLSSIGQPPAAPPSTIGAPPPPVPSTEPPPYDVLQDPAWAGKVHPNDHAWRTFLNELSPEHRQMLLQKMATPKPAPAALPISPPTPYAAPPIAVSPPGI